MLHYTPPQSLETSAAAKADEATPMDVDTEDKGKAKVEEEGAEKKEEQGLSMAQKAEVARVLFVLRLLTEFCLLYSSSLSVVLRRDWETGQGEGSRAVAPHPAPARDLPPPRYDVNQGHAELRPPQSDLSNRSFVPQRNLPALE